MIDWHSIDTVLCDMDGTLLDLRFDNHFWQEHLPRHYAARFHLPLDDARTLLAGRFRAAEGQLNWYCVDHWTRELGLDVVTLKSEVSHLIAWRPGAQRLLESLRAHGKRLVLVTNAHMKTMALKFARTGLDRHFDAVVCSHTLGCPKEDARFWPRFAELERFTPQTTLLIDDSLPVLRCARAFGIGHTLAIREPDSAGGVRDCAEFAAVSSFAEILPADAVGGNAARGSAAGSRSR
ncbi:MAG: GMP/IMP nucleotidase [Acidiferrobacteraceae bacterium]